MGRRNYSEDVAWEAGQTGDLLAAGFYPDGTIKVTDKAVQKTGVDLLGPLGAVELKMIRWPGRWYTAVTLEELSNVERGTPGWMDYSVADFLDYCFCGPLFGWRVYRYRMQELRAWFASARTRYPMADTVNAVGDAQYTTRCRVVSLADIDKFAELHGVPVG